MGRLRGLPRVAGHREGVQAARETVRAAGRVGIEYLTLYAFSSENWTRPAAEVSFLMKLLESSVDEELPELMDNNVRLRAIGRDRRRSARASGGSVERAVRGHRGQHGPHPPDRAQLRRPRRAGARGAVPGRGRRARRARRRTSSTRRASPARSTPPACPDPDLLIRTSGEFRLSNFLLWQIAYTELLVMPTLWPDFAPRDLYGAVAEFQRRSRRFGGL